MAERLFLGVALVDDGPAMRVEHTFAPRLVRHRHVSYDVRAQALTVHLEVSRKTKSCELERMPDFKIRRTNAPKPRELGQRAVLVVLAARDGVPEHKPPQMLDSPAKRMQHEDMRHMTS